MKLLGANPAARITGLDELPGKINYYLGNDSSKWRTGVPTYGRVRYQNVYPGIDLEFYGNQRQLEYDFIVAPGANPQAVRLAFEGPEKMAFDDEGNLVLHFPDGEIVQRAPVIYQMAGDTRRQVVGRFVRAENNEIRFLVGDYDSSLPLVIDPMVLSYSTYLGGSGSESG